MQTPESHPIPHLDGKYLPPGDVPKTWTPEDLILLHTPWAAWPADPHLGQRFRIRGSDCRYNWFDHAAQTSRVCGRVRPLERPGLAMNPETSPLAFCVGAPDRILDDIPGSGHGRT